MKIHQERALISILPLLLRRLQLLELLSHLVDIFCVSRVFVDAERLQELAKGHNAVTMFVLFLIHEGFQLVPQHCFLQSAFDHQVLGGFRDLAGVFGIQAEKRL